MDIEKTLLDELERMPISRYQLARETGIQESALSRFVYGERSLSLKAAQVLLNHFGYELKKKRGSKNGNQKN